MANLKELYTALKADGCPLPDTYEKFQDYMTSGPNHGYTHRKEVYDALKADGAPLPDTYEAFSKSLFVPANQGAFRRTDQIAADKVRSWNIVREPEAGIESEKNVTQDRQQPKWQAAPIQKALMSRSVQSQVDQFKASNAAILQRTQNISDYVKGGGGITGAPVKGKMSLNAESGKVEQTYLTPAGTATADKAMAERETRAFNEYVDNMTVAGQLRRAGRDLQELYRKREARVKAIEEEWAEDYKKNTAPLAAVLAADTYRPSIEGDPEYRALTAAIHQAQKRVQTMQHENDRQQGKDVGYWRGFGEVVGDIKTWDFGYSGLLDAMTMLDASKSSPKALPKTEAQKAAQQTMLEQTAEAQAAQAAYGQNDSFMNRAGVMTGEMLPFMLDFALMGGSNSGTSTVTRIIDAALLKSLRSAAPKVARNKAVQWTVKALGAMPEDLLYRAPLMTNTVQGMKTASDIIDRKLGDVVVREDGTYDFSNDKTWGSAIWQGEANAIIENYSEMFGTHLEGVLSMKTLGKIADTFGAKRLSGILAKASGSELAGIAGTMQKHLNQLGVSDYFGEVGEEYYGQLWRTMLNLDDACKQNPDGTRTNLFFEGQFHGDIWGGMALSMGFMGAGKYTLSAAAYGSMKHQVNKADARASEIFTPEVWDGWRERIDGTTNADIGSMAETIISDTSLTPEQREAAMNYMEATLNLRGFNLASVARQRGGEQPAEEAAANESYMDGYAATTPQEMNDAKRMLDLHRQRLAYSLSDDMVQEYDADPIGALSRTADPELRRIAADYVNARQVYEGMIQRVRDDIDVRIARSDASIDSRVNRQTGSIQPATMTNEGKEQDIDIVDGEVTFFEDGSGVDKEKSSESLIIRDRETGKIEFIDPLRIKSVGEAIDPVTEKEAARQQIRQEIAQTAADNIDGVLSFAPGESYSVLDLDGNQEPITILGNSVDEEGLPVEGSVDIQYSDGTIQTVSTSDLQQWVDSANDQRVAQFAEERAAERAAADEAERQADETGESVLNAAENAGIEAQTVTESVSNDNGVIDIPSPEASVVDAMLAPEEPQPSALSQIPTDEKGAPIYEQADPGTAWDALLEESEDEQIAQSVIAQEIAEREDALKKLEKQKPKAGLSTREKIQAEKDKKKAMNDIRKSIDHWKSMSATKQRRQAEAEAILNEEVRRRAEERMAQEEHARAEREEAERQEREAINGVPDWSHDTPQDARARGYRRNGPEFVRRQEPVHAERGKEVKVKFAEKELPKGRVAIIEASTLQPSHIEGSRNPLHFLDEAQPKERNDGASIDAARKIASNIRPEEITSSVTAYTGAPTVNARGEAIQGNSRSDSLRLMYESYPEQAAKYKHYLMDHAEEFGLTKEQVEAMEQPVLVNMLDVDDTEAIRLGQYVAQDTESGGIERIKAKNAVNKMGDKISSFANILLESSDEETSFAELLDRNGIEALKYLAQRGFITQTQYTSAFDTRGNLTAEAKNDLKGILYQSVFTGGSTKLEEMFGRMPAKAQKAILSTAFRDRESNRDDSMLREIQQSVMLFDALMNDADFRDARNLTEAIGAAEMWRRQYAADDVTGEPFLPSERFSNFAMRLAAIYKGGTQKFIQRTFNDLYDSIQGAGEDTLFEEADKMPRTLAEAIKKVLDIDYQPIKEKGNESYRRDVVALDGESGERGGSGGNGDVGSREHEPDGGRTADSGAGTSTDSRARDNVAALADNQGNPIDQEGRLIVENVQSIDEITDEDFTNPIRNIGLPVLPDKVSIAIGADGRKPIIKRNILSKNLESHKDLSPEDSRKILNEVLYNPNLYGQNQKDTRPYNWILVHLADKNSSVIVEVNPTKEHIEIVNWHYLNARQLDQKKRQAEREGGRILTLQESNAAGDTSQGLSSNYKDNISSSDKQEEREESSLGERIAEAEANVNDSPTDKQKEAGNYKKGHVQVGTFDITIENRKGSVRRGTDANGKKWESKMNHTYGYIKGTEGVDGDHIDVFLHQNMDDWNGRKVYVVDQYNPDNTFDEHKVMLGFNDRDEAFDAYLSNYEEGWEKGRRLDCTEVNLEDFEKWIESSHRKTKAFADYKSVKALTKDADQKGTNANPIKEIEDKGTEQDEAADSWEKEQIEYENRVIVNERVTDSFKKLKEADKAYRDVAIERVFSKDTDKALAQEEQRLHGEYHSRLEELAESLMDMSAEEAEEAASDDWLVDEIYKHSMKYDYKEDTHKKFQQVRNRLERIISGRRGAEAYKHAEDLNKVPARNKPVKFRMIEASDRSRNADVKWEGVSHLEADKIALSTNGRVMVASTKDYDPAHADKRVDAKGNEIGNVLSIPYKRILNRKGEIITSKRLKADEASGLPATLKNIPTKERSGKKVVVALGRGTYLTYKASEFDLFLRSALHIGAKEINFYDDGIARAESREGVALVLSLPNDGEADLRMDMSRGIRLHAGSGKTAGDRQTVYEATRGLVEASGVPVVEVGDEEASAMLGNKKTPVTDQPNRANEKLTSGSVLLSAKGDSSSNANVPSEANAKIKNNTQKTKNNIRKYNNGDAQIDISSVANSLRSVGDLFGMRNRGGSRYTILQTDGGKTVAVRLSDHGANGNNFRQDNADNNLSIVIERRKYDTPDSEIEFTEATIPESTFNERPQEVVSAIVKGVEDVLADREFTLDSSLGTVEKKGSGVRLSIGSDRSKAEMAERDKAYMDAVKRGDMETAQRMVDEAAEVAGYVEDSSYQGTSAFNGAAPYNGYGWSKDERRNLWKNGEFEGDYTLGDYVDFIGEPGDQLDFLLNHPNGLRTAGTMGRESIMAIREAIRKGDRKIKVYRSVPSSVKEGSLRDGDWVTPSKTYAKDNAAVHGWGSKYHIIEQTVDFDDLWWDGNDINEWGFDSGSRSGYKNTRNNRKLLDAVTYDDQGNVIPLSKRFNQRKSDIRFLKDGAGRVYGWTVGGKIYLNKDAMNPETPIHEYTHLWDEMVQKENPELWERGKDLMKETPVWQEVLEDPNYADIREDEDAIASEVHSRFTGERGARRMEEMIDKATKDGPLATAKAVTLVERLKGWLKDMFKALKGTLEKWSKRDLDDLTVDDFVNLTLRDLAEGMDPNAEMRRGEQTRLVTEENPMLDDYHTGIRKRDDVLTFDEMLKEAERDYEEYGDMTYPDMTIEMLRDARESGRIVIYSSKPIEPGVFVTSSRMNAEDYAGGPGGKVYEKTVPVDNVAWIDDSQGQYAPVGELPGRPLRYNAAMSRGREDFDAMRERAISERGIVMPGLNEAEIRVLEVPRHDFEGESPIAQARKWAKENIAGEHELIDSKGQIVTYTIASRVIEKYLSETAIGKSDNLGVHLSVLKSLPEVIGESVEAEVHPDYKKGADGIRSFENGINTNNLVHRFYGAVEIDGRRYRVKTTIIENGEIGKNKPHSFEVTAVEFMKELESGRTIMDALDVPASPETNLISVAKLLKDVEKSYDSGVKLLDLSEKDVETWGDYGSETAHDRNSDYHRKQNKRRATVQMSLFDEDDFHPAVRFKVSKDKREDRSEEEMRAEIANEAIDRYAERCMSITNSYEELIQRAKEDGSVGISDGLEERMASELQKADMEFELQLTDYYKSEGNSGADASRMARDMAMRVRADITMRLRDSGIESVGRIDAHDSHTQVKEGVMKTVTAGGARIRYELGRGAENSETDLRSEKMSHSASSTVPALPLRKLQPGEFTLVERRFTETGEFGFTGKERIESVDDVAYIFRSLEDSSVENSFVALVKDGRPLVIHLGMGLPTATMVDTTAIRAAYDAHGADQIYFIHNHPSGNLRQSPQDESLLKSVKGMFPEGIVQDGIIIDVTSGKYSTFNNSNQIHDFTGEDEVTGDYNHKVYRFNKNKFSPEYDFDKLTQIRSSGDVASFVATRRLGEGKKLGYIILNRANKIVGNLHSSYSDLKEDREAIADEVTALAVAYGGTSVILYGNVELTGSHLLGNAINEKSGKAIRLLDSMKIESGLSSGYQSAMDEGLLEPGSEYGATYVQEPMMSHRGTAYFNYIRAKAIDEKGIVNPGLNEAEVKIVEVPRHDFPGTGKQALQAGEAWAKENITGIHQGTDSRGNTFDYSISKDAIGKYLSQSATEKSDNIGAHLAALKKLPEIISESIEAEIHADYIKSNGKRRADNDVNEAALMHRFYGAVNIDGKIYRVKTTIREYADENRPPLAHSYEITKIELLEAPSDGVINNSGEPLAMTSNNSISVAKLLKDVEKSYDPGVKLLEASESNTNTMEGAIARISEKLHIPIRVISRQESQSMGYGDKKGWYNRRTGGITVVLSNSSSAEDMEATILHEAVAHHGLRQLFGEKFDEFLDTVYDHAEDRIKEEIALLASRNGWNRRVATEEYMARLAETTDFTDRMASWWRELKDLFYDFLMKCGFSPNIRISDNELRYVLWMSWRNLQNPGMYRGFLGEAERVSKESELKVGNYSEEIGSGWAIASESETIEETNRRFNKQLQLQIDGKLPAGHIYELGKPGNILRSTGIPGLPIQLNASRLSFKATSSRHDFDLQELNNIVHSLQEPIAVFAYGDSLKAQNIVLEVRHNGKNFMVGLSLRPTVKGRVLEINSVRTIYPKDNHEWLKWISDGKLLYVNKEKIQPILTQQRMNLADVEKIGLDLDYVVKIVNSFENPAIEVREKEEDGEELFRDGDFTPHDRVTARDYYERMLSRGSWQFREAVLDSMLGLHTLYESILTEGDKSKRKKFRIEDVAGYKNAYLYENRMSGSNKGEQHQYFTEFMNPLLSSIHRLCGSDKLERRMLTDYMIAKYNPQNELLAFYKTKCLFK